MDNPTLIAGCKEDLGIMLKMQLKIGEGEARGIFDFRKILSAFISI